MMRSIIFILGLTLFLGACKSSKADPVTNNETTRSATKSKDKRGDKKGPPNIDEGFKMDINQDGQLSKAEVKGRMLQDFAKFDSNNDGFISKEEFKNAPRPKRGQGGRQRK